MTGTAHRSRSVGLTVLNLRPVVPVLRAADSCACLRVRALTCGNAAYSTAVFIDGMLPFASSDRLNRERVRHERRRPLGPSTNPHPAEVTRLAAVHGSPQERLVQAVSDATRERTAPSPRATGRRRRPPRPTRQEPSSDTLILTRSPRPPPRKRTCCHLRAASRRGEGRRRRASVIRQRARRHREGPTDRVRNGRGWTSRSLGCG